MAADAGAVDWNVASLCEAPESALKSRRATTCGRTPCDDGDGGGGGHGHGLDGWLESPKMNLFRREMPCRTPDIGISGDSNRSWALEVPSVKVELGTESRSHSVNGSLLLRDEARERGEDVGVERADDVGLLEGGLRLGVRLRLAR